MVWISSCSKYLWQHTVHPFFSEAPFSKNVAVPRGLQSNATGTVQPPNGPCSPSCHLSVMCRRPSVQRASENIINCTAYHLRPRRWVPRLLGALREASKRSCRGRRVGTHEKLGACKAFQVQPKLYDQHKQFFTQWRHPAHSLVCCCSMQCRTAWDRPALEQAQACHQKSCKGWPSTRPWLDALGCTTIKPQDDRTAPQRTDLTPACTIALPRAPGCRPQPPR